MIYKLPLYRWVVKKLARNLVVKTKSLRVLFAGSQLPEACVRVLTYHRFANELRDPFCVRPADFDAQMEVLARERRAVSLDQVLAFVSGAGSLPVDACLVTIDDGMLSTLREALPILEKHRIPAVAFVSSALVGLNLPDLPEPYLTINELKVLNESPLITIGSHAHTHRSMGELPLQDMREEAEISRRLLGEYVGSAIDSFAYPFGMQLDFNEATDRALEEVGYEVAFNSMHGAIIKGMAPIGLPRIKIEGGESLATFVAITRGAMDAWRLIDDRFWRAQRVRKEIA